MEIGMETKMNMKIGIGIEICSSIAMRVKENT